MFWACFLSFLAGDIVGFCTLALFVGAKHNDD